MLLCCVVARIPARQRLTDILDQAPKTSFQHLILGELHITHAIFVTSNVGDQDYFKSLKSIENSTLCEDALSPSTILSVWVTNTPNVCAIVLQLASVWHIVYEAIHPQRPPGRARVCPLNWTPSIDRSSEKDGGMYERAATA